MLNSGKRICSGTLTDFEALGVGGDPIYRAAIQIRSLIVKELGSRTAEIFSAPVRDEKRNSIDWYTSLVGEASTLDKLSPDSQLIYHQEISSEFDKIRQLGERLLTAGGSDTEKTYGKLLKSILVFPNDSQVFIINERPVIAFWGFREHQPTTVQKENVLKNPLTPPLPPAPEPSISPAVIPPLPSSSQPLPSPKIVSDPVINNPKINLQNDSYEQVWFKKYWWRLLLLLLLLLGILFLLQKCQSGTPIGAALGVKNECLIKGQVDCPDVLVVPTAKSEGPQIQRSTPEAIPLTPEALKRKDLTVFAGNWTLITDLFNARTKEKIVVDFSFDENGTGKARVLERNGNLCEGTATTLISSEQRFDVNMSSLPCADGSQYSANHATCLVRTNFRQADCEMKCVDGACSAVFEQK